MRYFALAILLFSSTLLSAQSITSVTPNSAYAGDSLTLTIMGMGTDFEQGSMTYNTVYLRQGSDVINGTAASPTSDTEIMGFFNIPLSSGLGLWDVIVWNISQGEIIGSNTFEIKSKLTYTKDIASNSDLMFYPNPVHDAMNLNPMLIGKKFRLLDIDGKLLKSGTVKYDRIDMSSMEIGLYFLVIDNELHKVFKD